MIYLYIKFPYEKNYLNFKNTAKKQQVSSKFKARQVKMSKNIKAEGGLSGKSKINIFIGIFLVSVVLTIFFSINQIVDVIEKREKIVELEEKLSWIRNNNIKLLALEKSLYQEDTVELEARKQFNMTGDENEINFYVTIEKDEDSGQGQSKTKTELSDDAYSNADLWENIKNFYNKEINNQ